MQLRLIRQGVELRNVKKETVITNLKLRSLWRRYQSHDLSPMQLLKRCTKVYFKNFSYYYQNMTSTTNANVDESNLYECLFEDQDYSMFNQPNDNFSDEEEMVEGEESEDEDAEEEPSLPMPERELDDESSSEEDI